MSVSYLPPDVLRKSVFDLVSDCRKKLHEGVVDMSMVESSVRAYCESIASLPIEEGRAHRESLHELMDLMTKLGEELAQMRDTIKAQLGNLEGVRKAHIAYKNFNHVGLRKEPSDDGQ